MGTFGGYSGSKIIPEDKKEIFSQQMLKILNYGGMMNFEAIKLYGQEMGLLKPVDINSKKDIWFHYNYFEDDFWETAGFKIKDCRLWSEKIGNAERYALYRIELGYGEFFSEKMFSKMIPRELKYAADEREFEDLYYIVHGTLTLENAESQIKSGTYSADVLKCKRLLKKYFESAVENSREALWELLTKEYILREKENDSRLKEIAEMSLRIPARVFVYLAVEIDGNMEFWEVWKELKGVVYQDEHRKNYTPKEVIQWKQEQQKNPVVPISTSKFLRQEESFIFYMPPKELRDIEDYYISDDDRLYWWDGSDEVRISTKTEQWLKGLVKQYKELGKTKEYMEAKQDFQRFFWKTIVAIDEYYERIYPFQTMFYEFLENGNREEYITAIVLLKKMADSEEYRKKGEIIKYAKSWNLSSRSMTHNNARIYLKRYLSVMANKKLRYMYFGF